MKIAILFTYRNRELRRIIRSLDSLKKQHLQNFEVLFIDYGSKKEWASQVKLLISHYDFVTYEYLYTELQPWNKSKALNYAIRNLKSEYFFTADIDMIFHPKFTSILQKKSCPKKGTYFQVGYLSEEESNKELLFEEYIIKFYSNEEATGMTLVPVSVIKNIRGYDEFFHFWGSEDTDIHNRLKTIGFEVEYYNDKTVLLHQWHKNYRNRETKELNKELQLTGIVEINNLYMLKKENKKEKKDVINEWGSVLSKEEFDELESIKTKVLSNEKDVIDYFLYQELPFLHQEIIGVSIKENPFKDSFKYKIKILLGKKVPQFYTLKEINDKLLLHIVSFYHQFPYSYKVSDDLRNIEFKIKK
ncbi:MAG: glycosyltransferase involved in cell wall biosynthesis [Flavobacterium sp.]